MIDPNATIGCRAWISCPMSGADGADGADRAHGDGWCYLLGYEVSTLFCQCPGCGHRFWWDTGFGVGGGSERHATWWPATG
jgi:hypothetical protein